MEESKIDGGNSLRKRIEYKLRIGNRYLNWFAEKYCEKILNRKLLLDLDCEKLVESEMLS